MSVMLCFYNSVKILTAHIHSSVTMYHKGIAAKVFH